MDAETRAGRPVAPDLSFKRRVRRIIGIREQVMDWVPEERPRYTKLAVIVLITGVISGLSMMIITTRLFTGWWTLLAVFVAVGWGYAILMIDSWLVSSMHGGRAKVLTCLPRLLISILLGVVIAEPVVVFIFRPAIEQEVADKRNAELATFSSAWKACNPPTGEVIGRPECADHHLNLASSLTALRTHHDNLTAQRDQLRTDVASNLARWDQLERLARAECKGTPGAETTGVAGEGPECSRNRVVADQFRRGTRLDQRQADLADMDRNLVGLKDAVKQAENSYATDVESAIAAKIGEWKESRKTTGILEELDALGELADKSTPVNVAHWVLRLLLVLFDCLPVLTKWLNGRTAYDKAISREIETSRKLHEEHLTRSQKTDATIWDAHHTRVQQEHRGQLHAMAEEDRRAKRQRERALDEEIERVADELRRESAWDLRPSRVSTEGGAGPQT
ncbi:DUF4407 domain-containing protein [Herbihabitans rhizosphaerae]|nr:DUF4407 domain-containing protein [Herbihabitans rhizosphaerae]